MSSGKVASEREASNLHDSEMEQQQQQQRQQQQVQTRKSQTKAGIPTLDDRKSLAIIMLVIFVGNVTAGISFPFLLWTGGGKSDKLYGGRHEDGGRGLQHNFYCYVFGAFSLGRVMASPFFGRLSTAHGYRVALIASSVALVVGSLIEAFGPTNIAVVALARFLYGVGSGTFGVTRGYVAEKSDISRRTYLLAYTNVFQYAGFICTPLLSASLFSLLGQRQIPIMDLGDKNTDGSYATIVDRLTAPALVVAVAAVLLLGLLCFVFRDNNDSDHDTDVKTEDEICKDSTPEMTPKPYSNDGIASFPSLISIPTRASGEHVENEMEGGARVLGDGTTFRTHPPSGVSPPPPDFRQASFTSETFSGDETFEVPKHSSTENLFVSDDTGSEASGLGGRMGMGMGLSVSPNVSVSSMVSSTSLNRRSSITSSFFANRFSFMKSAGVRSSQHDLDDAIEQGRKALTSPSGNNERNYDYGSVSRDSGYAQGTDGGRGYVGEMGTPMNEDGGGGNEKPPTVLAWCGRVLCLLDMWNVQRRSHRRLDEGRKSQREQNCSRKNRQLILGGCLALTAVTTGAIACFETVGAEYATTDLGMSPAALRYAFAVLGSLGIVSLLSLRILCGVLTDMQIVLGGVFAMSTGCAMLLVSSASNVDGRILLMAAGLLMCSIGYPVGNAAALGLFSKAIGRHPQGTLLGWYDTTNVLALALFALTAGSVSEDWGKLLLVSLVAIFTATFAAICCFAKRT